MIRSCIEIQSLKGKKEAVLVNPHVEGLVLNGLDQGSLDNINDFSVSFEVNRDPDFFLYGIQWFQAVKKSDFDFVVRTGGKQGDTRRKISLRFFNGEVGESCLKVDVPYACLTTWTLEQKRTGEVCATFKFTAGPKKLSAQANWDAQSHPNIYMPTKFDENSLQIEQAGLSGFKKKFKISLVGRYVESVEVGPVHRRPTPGEAFRTDFIKSSVVVLSSLTLSTENDSITGLVQTYLETTSKRNEAKKMHLSWSEGCGHLTSIDFRSALLSSVRPQTIEENLGKFQIKFFALATEVKASKELFALEMNSLEECIEVEASQLRSEADFPEVWRASQSIFGNGIDGAVDCIMIKPSLFPFFGANVLTQGVDAQVSFYLSTNGIESDKEPVVVLQETESFLKLLLHSPERALSKVSGDVSETLSASQEEFAKLRGVAPKRREKAVLVGVDMPHTSRILGILNSSTISAEEEKTEVSLCITVLGTKLGSEDGNV